MVLHVCAVIQPTVEAHAKINWNSLNVDRSLCLNVSYQYRTLMLARALLYSLLAMIGLWYGRHRDSVERAEYRQALLDERATKEELEMDEATLDAELDQTEGSYFPWRTFFYFALPWTLTFVVSGVLNYGRLYFVIQHFCLTYWQTVSLYVNIQMLFLRHMTAALVDACWRQFFGSVDDPSIRTINHITFETHLLATE
ncbi:GL15461 [Drosophila persimilis]|uniref:GL15461 n=1 Tax=Drosophila persimilis TaxID=7234 RepID=B4H6Q9_DROPE|nr:GL15461 [Drosophila persimilis]